MWIVAVVVGTVDSLEGKLYMNEVWRSEIFQIDLTVCLDDRSLRSNFDARDCRAEGAVDCRSQRTYFCLCSCPSKVKDNYILLYLE